MTLYQEDVISIPEVVVAKDVLGDGPDPVLALPGHGIVAMDHHVPGLKVVGGVLGFGSGRRAFFLKIARE